MLFDKECVLMGSKGIIFNIQKFSIHDGPGVRTTVFLKGCLLRCRWCANPESQIPKVQIMYDSKNCVYCQTCIASCPENAVFLSEKGRICIDFAKCRGCLTCVHGCPGRALTYEGEYRTVDEVFKECMKDIDFYEESGGGVTISGGEGMVQPDFAETLILRLKENGVHTAIETTGHVSPAVFQRLAPQFDLLLFDVKQADSAKHKAGTGVGNELILQNLRWAQNHGLNILPRIPVIPGFNAELEDAQGIAALLEDIGLKRVQLLPFHQMGERKYEFLNQAYQFAGVKALHPEDLREYQQVFLDGGIDCFF